MLLLRGLSYKNSRVKLRFVVCLVFHNTQIDLLLNINALAGFTIRPTYLREDKISSAHALFKANSLWRGRDFMQKSSSKGRVSLKSARALEILSSSANLNVSNDNASAKCLYSVLVLLSCLLL